MPSDGAALDDFGVSVALAGDTPLVGAQADDDQGDEKSIPESNNTKLDGGDRHLPGGPQEGIKSQAELAAAPAR